MKISTKISLPISILVFICLLTATIYLMFGIERQVEDKVAKDLKVQVNLWEKNLVSTRAEKFNAVKKDLKVLQKLFTDNKLKIVNDSVEIKAVNQITKVTKDVKVKKWLLDGKQIQFDEKFVDDIQKLVGGTATIFQKIDDGYLRISTNVKTKDGKRATGTFIPNDSSVIKTINKGETYYGRAFVVDDWYLTGYSPIYYNNEVVGILYAGVKEKDLGNLRKSMREFTIGKTGYFGIMTDKGEAVIHPTSEGKDLSKVEIVKKVLEKKSGYLIEDFDGKKVVTAFSPFKEYNWIVYAVVPIDEISSSFVRVVAKAQIIVIVVVLIVLIIGSVIITKKALSPMQDLVSGLKQGTSGDLTTRLKIKTKDEFAIIGEEFNKFLFKLNDVINNIIDLSEKVSNENKLTEKILDNIAAGEKSLHKDIAGYINNGLSQLDDRITRQLDEVRTQTAGAEETLASVEEVASASNMITRSAGQTLESSNKSVEIAMQGSSNANKLSSGMNNISSSVLMANEKIRELEDLSKGIDGIVGAINGLSEQTNLLALNAAIEAARAGEAGRGFAVVADEIRKLAEQTSNETDKIEQIIVGIQKEINSVVDANEIVDKNVKDGIDLTNLVKNDITEIIEISEKNNEEIANINSAASEQAIALDEISSAVSTMAESSTEIEGSGLEVVEITATVVAVLDKRLVKVKELTKLAEKLEQDLTFFKTK